MTIKLWVVFLAGGNKMYNPVRNYTLEEYWELVSSSPGPKYEYIHGHIRMMSGGTLAHAQIGANISRLIGNALLESECNVYSGDAVVQIAEGLRYMPDVSVTCDPHDWTRKIMQAPTVVVEVLSPSTERIDKKEKLPAYQHNPTIQDILFVDSRKHYIEHYHRAGPEAEWQTDTYKGDDETINLASIEVTLLVRDIYHKVYLELEEAEQ